MLYFLNDEECNVSFKNNRTTGYKKYEVYINDKLVFVGNTYVLKGHTATIALNDIYNEYMISHDIRHFVSTSGYNMFNTTCVLLNVEVKIYDNNVVRWSSSIKFFATTPYINGNYENYIKEIYNNIGDYHIINLLQTTEEKLIDGEFISETKYLPHIPFVKSSNYGLSTLLWSKKIKKPEEVIYQWYFGDNQTADFDALDYNIDNGYKLSSTLNGIYLNYSYNDSVYVRESYLPEPADVKKLKNGVEIPTSDDDYVDCRSEVVVDKHNFVFSDIDFEQLSIVIYGNDNMRKFESPYTESGTYRIDLVNGTDTKTFRISLNKYIKSEEYEMLVETAYINFYPKVPNNNNISMYFTLYFDEDGNVFVKNIAFESKNKTKIAEVDECPAKYYLMWQDRLGGIQSQGFDGKNEFSETFTYTTVERNTGHKNIISSSSKPKWSLNTKFIKEEMYSIYESIFTSPTLLLYDVENDKIHNVIPTGKSFKEKTWENEKKMYNFSIEVEKNIEQKILA